MKHSMRNLALAVVGLAFSAHSIAASQAARNLRFETDEGTWMSVDVSADGRTIVFELLGDLYTLPIGGGRAKRLTSGPAFDAQPRYSPDGRQIVFVSDRNGAENLWIMSTESGEAQPLTSERGRFMISPEWSPDGGSIVVSSSTRTLGHQREYQLFAYPVASPSVGRRITGADNSGPATVLGAAFARDPNEIVAAIQTPQAWPSVASWQIAAIDPVTGHISQMTYELASAMRPVLSPDGRYLVFATPWQGKLRLKLVDRQSHRERWLLDELDFSADGETAPRRDLLPGASFTPDGEALVVAHHGKFWRVTVADGRATQIPFTALIEAELAPLAQFDYPLHDDAVAVRRIEQPRRAPDGCRLAFSALDRIWVQDLCARKAPVQLSVGEDGAFFPTWSPDSRFVAYVSWNDLRGGDIWRVRADGKSQPERLSRQSAFYEKLAYSPDGRRLLAARGHAYERAMLTSEVRNKGRGQSSELIWLPASGGAATRITGINAMPRWTSSHYGLPHFSLDSSRIHFNDPVDGLLSVRWDGSERRTILRVEGPAVLADAMAPADDLLLSPNGRQVVALLSGQVWLLPLPSASDAATTVTLPSGAAAAGACRLSLEGGDFPSWSADGRALHWSLGSTFFSQDVTAIPFADSLRTDIALEVKRDIPRGSVMYRGARVITMRGNEIIERADLLVVDNRIRAVGSQGSIDIPPETRVLDVGGRTILPGYVDVHWHGDVSWGVHRTQVWENMVSLAYGVTAIRDPQPTTPDILTYADRLAASGERGPRIFSTGRGVFRSDDIRSAADAQAVARRHALFYRTETLKDYMVNADREVHRWLADAAREYRLTPTAESNSDLKYSITRIFDGYGGQEHMPSATKYYRDLVQLIALSGMTISETTGSPAVLERPSDSGYSLGRLVQQQVLHADQKVRRYFPQKEIDYLAVQANEPPRGEYASLQLAGHAKAILDAGGRIALGTHGALQGLGAHWILWTLVEGGMHPHDALRVATLMGAEAIGHGHDFGSIEPGKLADLQVLEGNPLEDIRHTLSLRYVSVNGRLYDASTLDQIWPQSQALGRQWWHRQTGNTE